MEEEAHGLGFAGRGVPEPQETRDPGRAKQAEAMTWAGVSWDALPLSARCFLPGVGQLIRVTHPEARAFMPEWLRSSSGNALAPGTGPSREVPRAGLLSMEPLTF